MLESLANTPLPTIFVVCGIGFIFIAIGGQFGAHIVANRVKPLSALIIGVLFTILGISLYVLDQNDDSSASKSTENKVIIEKSVKKVRPFTSCAIVKGIRFDDNTINEVIDIQEKLHGSYGRNRKKLAIGIYPLEEIKLPIRFLARKPEEIKFQPLESEKEMSAAEILEKHPAGKEYSPLLAGKIKFPLFIDGKKQILSMPPIINSELTGKISEKTREVFIECSGFDFEILEKCLNIIDIT